MVVSEYWVHFMYALIVQSAIATVLNYSTSFTVFTIVMWLILSAFHSSCVKFYLRMKQEGYGEMRSKESILIHDNNNK